MVLVDFLDYWFYRPFYTFATDGPMASTLLPNPAARTDGKLSPHPRGEWADSAVGDRRATQAVLLLIVGTALLRVFTSAAVGLGYGESYHFSCSLRPNWGYFDHPPLGVLLGSLSMALTGSKSAWAVRLPFIVLFAGTTWLTYVMGRRLFSAWAGFYAALLLNLSAVFTLSVGCFLQSDGPLMFFWLACTWFLANVFLEPRLQRPYWQWLGVGVTLGLAMLSKYHAVFLLFGGGMFALTVADQRKWIIHPGPYSAIVVAGLIFSPVLYWNSQHQWISFLWQGNRGLDYQGIRWDWLARNLGGQALWLLPWIWAPLLWELPVCFRAGPENRARWFLAWLAVAPIVIFTAVSAYAPIGFHFHWQAPGYLLLLLALGDTIHRKLRHHDISTRWWLRGTLAFTCVGLLFFTTHAATGWWRQWGPQWLSDKFGESDDPTLEALDYHTLAAAIHERGLHREDVFLFTNRWFQSGKVDYAMGGQMPVLCLSPDPRSFAFFDRPEQWLGKDGILVATNKFLADPGSWYAPYFDAIEPLGTVPVPRAGFVEETLYLYRCRNLHTIYPLPY